MFLIISVSYSQSIIIENVNTSNAIKPNDLFYALPKTVLKNNIKIEEEIFRIPKVNVTLENIFSSGPNSTKIPNKTEEEKREVKVKSISFETKAIPDDEHIYRIHLKKKWNRKNIIDLKIGKNGLIQGGELTSEDKTFKIITTGLSNLISTLKDNSKSKPYDPAKDNAKSKPYDPVKDGERIFKELKLTEIKTNPSTSAEEHEIAEKLKSLITKRNLISSDSKKYSLKLGQLKTDFVLNNDFSNNIRAFKYKVSTLEKMLSSLKEQKEKTKKNFIETLNSFMGTKSSRVIDIESDLDAQFNHKSFSKIDEYYKVEYPSDSIEAQIKSTNRANLNKVVDGSKCESCFRITISRDVNDFGTKFYSSINTSSTNLGLAYKLPASYTAKIFTNNIGEIGSFTFFAVGDIYGRLSSKANLNNLVYYPELGWFKEINATTKSINSDDISSVGKSLGETVDFIKGKSEAESLKEETDLLELKIKKLELEKKLKEKEDNEDE